VNWFDYIFVFMFVAFAIQGLAEGFSRIVFGLLATLAGLLIASWSYGTAASFLQPYMSSRAVANVLGFFLVFAIVQIFGALCGAVAARLFRWAGLSWLDRLLGFAVGGLKAVVFGVIIVLILTAFPMKPVPEAIAQSRVAPYLIDAAHLISYMAPRELRDGFSETYDRIRGFWKHEVTPKGHDPLPPEPVRSSSHPGPPRIA
jgi:membrane protein required for colicin V production